MNESTEHTLEDVVWLHVIETTCQGYEIKRLDNEVKMLRKKMRAACARNIILSTALLSAWIILFNKEDIIRHLKRTNDKKGE